MKHRSSHGSKKTAKVSAQVTVNKNPSPFTAGKSKSQASKTKSK